MDKELIETVVKTVVNTINQSNNLDISISLDEALVIGLDAIKKANSINVKVSISICDKHGNQVFFSRMDDALLVSIELAPKKAFTSIALRMPTEDVKKAIDASLCSLGESMGGKIVLFGGGIPIFKNGHIIGAIGVSGGSVEEDIIIANAGIECMKN